MSAPDARLGDPGERDAVAAEKLHEAAESAQKADIVTAPRLDERQLPDFVTRHRTKAFLLAVVFVALFIRCWSSYDSVFTAAGVNFQEGDAWYHVRTTHNLLAHFPWRSGFDPYALYPGGQNMATGPFWDYLLGTAAWILGFGRPSATLIDNVAAWMPAVLGALFPLGVFWLTRRLLSTKAAVFAAVWIAVIPGAFLWQTHLGYADHHVAESLLSFFALILVCAAVEASGRWRWYLAIAAGASLAAYLATRPAGVFFVALFVAAALLELSLAPVIAAALATTCILFIPITGNIWTEYTWLFLGAGLAISAAAAFFASRGWSRWKVLLALAGTAVMISVCVWIAMPARVGNFTELIARSLGETSDARQVATVQELLPLLKSSKEGAWYALKAELGNVWLMSFPGLLAIVWLAFRRRRPALTLVAIWCVVLTCAAFLQVRMVTYYAVAASMLAGMAMAWLSSFGKPVIRGTVAVLLSLLFFLPNARLSVVETRANVSPSADWRDAFAWLRTNTPEPLGNSDTWYRYYPRQKEEGPQNLPASAYGVAVWWDYAYWMEDLARRIPTTNGTQAGAFETANYYVNPDAKAAIESMRIRNVRYMVLDPSSPFFPANRQCRFLPMVSWARRNENDYATYLVENDAGVKRPVLVYLPAYFRTLVSRLYLYDGQKAEPAGGVPVIVSHEERIGGTRQYVIDYQRKFPTEADAQQFIRQHDYEHAIIGSTDGTKTCVPLEPVPMRRVFASDSNGISVFHEVRAVKVFAVAR